jgi:hypothetical protein
MANAPSMRKRLVPFRGGTSSTDQNKTTEEIFYDLTHLFNLINEQSALLDEATEIARLQNTFQQLRVAQLEQQIINLQAQLNQQGNAYTKIIHVPEMLVDTDADPLQQATLDNFYNSVTLPVTGNVISKVYLKDDVTGEIIQPSTLKVDVSPSANGTTIIDKSDAKKAFDGNNDSYWHRVYIHDQQDPIQSEYAEIVVTLPDNIISNREINQITINPFPLNTLRIEAIEYNLNGSWTLLPGFPVDDKGNPIPYENAGFLQFCFPSIPISQIRVKVTQPNYVVENGQKVFHIGMQEIGVFQVGYLSTIGKFKIPTEIPGKSNNHMITSIIPHFKNETALTDKSADKRNIFSYAVYTYDENHNLVYTKDSLPIAVSGNDIVIKAQIMADPYTQATPALEYIEVTYQDM